MTRVSCNNSIRDGQRSKCSVMLSVLANSLTTRVLNTDGSYSVSQMDFLNKGPQGFLGTREVGHLLLANKKYFEITFTEQGKC